MTQRALATGSHRTGEVEIGLSPNSRHSAMTVGGVPMPSAATVALALNVLR